MPIPELAKDPPNLTATNPPKILVPTPKKLHLIGEINVELKKQWGIKADKIQKAWWKVEPQLAL